MDLNDLHYLKRSLAVDVVDDDENLINDGDPLQVEFREAELWAGDDDDALLVQTLFLINDLHTFWVEELEHIKATPRLRTKIMDLKKRLLQILVTP